jgi:hypothetical protein
MEVLCGKSSILTSVRNCISSLDLQQDTLSSNRGVT